MAMGIFEQLAWLTTRVKRLCCAVDILNQEAAATITAREANPCYLEIVSNGAFPYTTLADYNTNTTWATPFTALITIGGIQRLYGGSDVDIANIFAGNNDITSINDGCGAVTGMPNLAFNSSAALTYVNFPSVLTIPDSAFRQCGNLTVALFPKATSVDDNAFGNSNLLTDISLPLVTTLGASVFDGLTELKTVSLPKLTSVPASTFSNCINLTTINLSSVTDLGGTPGDDNVFTGITGNIITLTVPAAMSTIDGGSPDGDIVYLAANNTLTVNYI